LIERAKLGAQNTSIADIYSEGVKLSLIVAMGLLGRSFSKRLPSWLRRGVCTYELFPSGRKSVQVRIYADDANLLIGRASHCKPQEKPSNIGK
jgi:hypothetical protein